MRISDWSSDVCSSDLIAEQSGASHVEWPAEFAALDGQEQDDAREAIRLQQTQFDARSSVLAAQTGVLREQANQRSEEHTSELQSLMRISYAVFCLKKKTTT